MVKIKYSKAKKNPSVDKKQDRRLRKLEQKIGDPEYKQVGTIYPGIGAVPAALSNAVSVNGLSDIVAQGTSSSDRIGDQIRVYKIRFRLAAQYTENAGLQFVRVLIGQDHKYDGTSPTGAQLLTSYDTVNNTVTNAQTPLNADFCTLRGLDSRKVKSTKFYSILYDKVIWLPTVTAPGGTITPTVQPVKTMSWDKTFKYGLPVQYSGANQKAGRIFLAMFPGNSTSAGKNPVVNMNVEIYWKDL